jgi:hypothetical protein
MRGDCHGSGPSGQPEAAAVERARLPSRSFGLKDKCRDQCMPGFRSDRARVRMSLKYDGSPEAARGNLAYMAARA